MKELELIEKWNLNKTFLAKKMGMLKGTFSNKFSPNHPTQLSDKEITEIRNILIEMSEDILNELNN